VCSSDLLADALTVPVSAVLNSGQRQTVFIALGEGRFEPRAVKSGLHDDNGRLQIVEGLSEGEQVVVSAQFMLDSESRLREALQKMTDLPKEPPASPAAKPAAVQKQDLNDLFK
jgi:Cu(I)/Ag(I) efflux system membrane fusion protein/cobalt-zinc-cadmium efflux system membrane fusion protein